MAEPIRLWSLTSQTLQEKKHCVLMQKGEEKVMLERNYDY